jgi:penicillin-binding protein 2
MFERRLKIFLLFVLLATIVLLARAMQVQVINHSYWTQRAAGLLQTTHFTETTRGRILDINGKVMAQDVPCTDACVDFRAIIDPPDPLWVAKLAQRRLSNRLGKDLRQMSAEQRKELYNGEVRQVQSDIETMWATLAELYQPTDDQIGLDHRAAIEDIRHSIVQRVEMRKRSAWFRNFQKDKVKESDLPQWRKWLMGGDSDGPDIDNFDVTVDEESQPHVVLRAIDPETANFLGKHKEQFPGLELQPSVHREYPLKNVACHLLGRMSRVSAQDLDDARAEKWDETRMYLPNDQIGREGVEALCEPLLRGSRGVVQHRVSDDVVVGNKPFVPGDDVRLSIDADLQGEIQEMLKHVREKKVDHGSFVYATPEPGMNMHGAAVVIDVKTGEVRALASNPDFDLNQLDDRYTALVEDKLDNPLVNRATCDEFEPGSTVKPMVGLGAITQGVLRCNEGIECTGYLILDVNGRKVRESIGRCWVASEFADQLKAWNMSVAHHPIPTNDPHRGHDGNPDGWLTYSDAIERSCNVFFETVADRLGPAGLSNWYDKFGFGRPTGIGILERRGLRPGMHPMDRMTNCFAGIGQGQVWATPLQIANEAATIARKGIWMRPRLISSQMQAQLDAARPPSTDQPFDQVDLHLDPEALRQAKIGMIAVVNSAAGTGGTARRDDMLVAAKTGTAQAARIWQRLVDQAGNKIREPLPPANDAHPNTGTEWYRSTDDDGKDIVHAWFMGFAPADDPEIAFCVLIEYGGAGGGGGVAGPVVANILDACVKHGYLHPHPQTLPIAAGE